MRAASARHRGWVLATIALTVAAGLASRTFPWLLPAGLGSYPGDALWALLVFLCLAFGWPRASGAKLAWSALAIAYAVELAQLYQAPWIDALRATTPGHLVLGQGFDPVDLLAYAIGVGAGYAADRTLARSSR